MIEASGTPYEMGVQRGEQAENQIQKYVPIFNLADTLTGLDIDEFVKEYEKDIENFSPEYIQEMKGIAKGANVPYEHILFLNMFLSLRCTTWGATGNQTKTGAAILGKNRDFTYAAYKTQIILKVNPENSHSFVALTNAGLVGMDQFLNEKGLTGVTNRVTTKKENKGVPNHLLLRKFAENCENVEQIPQMLDKTVVGYGNNLLLADNSNSISLIELAGGKKNYNVITPEDNIMSRTNHFITQEMLQHEAELSTSGMQRKNPMGSSTLHRKARIEKLMNKHKGNINPQIGEDINQDHYPHEGTFSICRHGAVDLKYDTNLSEMFLHMVFVYSGGTDASVIIQPENKIFKAAFGHPCETEYKTYKPKVVEE